MPNEEDRKWLYSQFKDNGYDTGSYEDFVKSLDNDEDFEWWHNEATSLGLEVGDLDEFGSLFRTQKAAEEPSETPYVTESGGDVTLNFDDEPNLDAIKNKKARQAIEKEQKRIAKEEEKARKEAQKRPNGLSAKERTAKFNEMARQRDVQLSKNTPEDVRAQFEAEEKQFVSERKKELAAQKKAKQDVERYGSGNDSYSFEEAVEAGSAFAEIAPEVANLDKKVAAFNDRYRDLEDKIALLNEGKLKLSQNEYAELQKEYQQYQKDSKALSELSKLYDSVLNSAPGREYKEISERMNKIAKGPKTAESALDYANEYANLQRNPLYRASMGENAPSEDEIQAGLLQGQIAYYEEKMKTAKGDERKALKKSFSDAKEALYANPWYRKDMEAKIATNKADNEDIGRERAEYVQRLREDWKAKGISPEYYWQMEKGDEELQRLDAAAHMHDDAIREYEKPTKYEEYDKNVFKGLKDWATDTDTWSFGLESFVEDIAVVRPVLEKVEKIVGNLNESDVVTDSMLDKLESELTPGEAAVLDAYFDKVGAVAAKGADTAIGYQIGQGIGDMVTLGIEMVASGPAGGAVRKVTERGTKKVLLNVLGKRMYRKAAQNGLGKVALWTTGKVVSDAVETAVRIPFMPSTYKAIGEEAVTLGSDYKLRPVGEYLPSAGWKQYVEQLTEVSNGFAFPLIGQVVKTPGITKFINGMLGDDAARALRSFIERGDIKLLDDAMIGSFGGEWEEELLGAVIHSITDDPNALRDFFSAEQQLVLLGTLAPLPLSRGAVGGLQLAVPSARAEVTWNKAQKELERLGFDEGRISRLKDVLDNASAPEGARAIMNAMMDAGYSKEDARKGGFFEAENKAENDVLHGSMGQEIDPDAYGALANYFWAAQQKRAVGLMKEVEEDRKVADKRAELEQHFKGAFYHKDANGEDVVETATMIGADGNPSNIYITSEAPNGNGEMAYVSENGDKGFVKRDELVSLQQDGTYAPNAETTVTPVNRFVADLVMQDAQDAEVQGVVNDVRAANQAIRQQVEALPEIKFNGNTGEITNLTEDGATFVPDDESEESVVVSWAELASQNGIQEPEVMTEAEKTGVKAAVVGTAFQAQQDIADAVRVELEQDIPPQIDTEEGPATVTGIIQNTIDPEARTAQFTVVLPDGRRSITMSIPIDSVFPPAGETEPEVQATAESAPEEPSEQEEAEEAEEAPKIPLDDKGNPVYDAPGVAVEDALEDMYSTEGLDEADVDEYIINRATEADKAKDVKQGKMSLKEWGQAKKEAKRIADFWAEAKEFAEANKAAREREEKEEEERQKLIEEYGVDPRGFDLTPQTMDEAIADGLAVFFRGDGRLSQKSVYNLIGKDKGSELFKQGYRSVVSTKPGAISVDKFVLSVMDEYPGLVTDEQEGINKVQELLLSKTRGELGNFIFNNRLDEARKLSEVDNEPPSGEPAPANAAEGKPYELSDEIDENGIPFVLTSGGEIEFGRITSDTGLTDAPILLSEGMITDPATNAGYGLVHIEARHGRQIREAGYGSVIDFVEDVAKNYEVIREGKDRDGNQTYLLQLTDKHDNTLIVELSGDGTYWNINTAGIFKTSYGANRRVVYDRHTTGKQSAETAGESLQEEQGGTTSGTSMDSPTQEESSSESKDNDNSGESNTPGEKTAEVPENKPEKPSESGENSVPLGEEKNVPGSPSEIKSKADALAYFESIYGKGAKANNAARVWELTHKKGSKKADSGNGMQAMAFSPDETGLTAEEQAELVTLGTQLAEDYIAEDGFVKFPQFFKNLVETFGDGIRPFSKQIYLGASANVSDEIADQMDDRKTVREFDTSIDLNDISDEQNSSTGVSEPGPTVSEPVSEPAEGSVPEGEGEVSGTDTGAGVEDDNAEGAGEAPEGGRLGDGGEGVSGTDELRDGGNKGSGTKRGRGGRPRSGSRGGRTRGSDSVNTEPGEDSTRGLDPEKAAAEAEQKAYEAEKESVKDETDTNKLKTLKDELKSKISEITEKFDLAKAEMSGRLRAVIERLRELFSTNANKTEALAQEKVPYSAASDPAGEHAIGSVVPSGSADAMRDAIRRLEAEEGKTVAEFVKDELGYKSLDEMFSSETKNEGLSSEQVDSVGLAIHQMKKGRMFIIGDMTGIGKGRQGAALIRWAKKNKKKCLFVTEKPDLFSDMYQDLKDIGTNDLLPFIVNNDSGANITEKNPDNPEDKTILVKHPTKAVADNLYKSDSDGLPDVKGDAKNKGKKYEFVMMTYSQAQGARTPAAQRKLDWIKRYAKDAIVICDESHNASGDSNRGKYFQEVVRDAQGVTFSSATFAKRPDNMVLYALRSSIGDVQMTQEDLVKAIQQYGIPMQEILAASLFKTGEMVRRERDFSDVKTHWYEPKEIYPEKEFEQSRKTFDKSIDVVNRIIDFQRSTVDPIIKQKNEDEFKDRNAIAEAAIMMGGEGDIYEYTTTPYSGQVSNVAGLMFYSIKAQKAAEMAIEQIKKGEKPVIAVENTLESYLKDIDGDVKTADFAFVLSRGLNTSLKHRLKITHKKYNPETKQVEVVKEKSSVQELGSVEQYFGEAGKAALEAVEASLREYSEDKTVMPLMLSPIDYIKKRIEEAGYKCGEITGRSLQLVQAPNGTWHTEPFKADKKKAISQFNGGETDALILNTAGSTGISLHASRRFKDQKKRNMIILQPARDPNTEVQIRGRVDRTGQVSRAEYFYITSPIPAEQKIIMMLRQKLASLDANSVGTENVSSNRVNADDMDNKYGDEVARQFLIDHPEINEQLDKSKQIEEKKGEYEHREGLLYDLLVGIQRMTCEEQEMILGELQSAYKDQIEYLNQNGINDLATTTMNLEAVTIDTGLFIKGKDNESMSAFAHDTNIERVEVNVINKPLRSSDINARMKKLGAIKEDGTIDPEYGFKMYSSSLEFINHAKIERRAKHLAAEEKLENELREQYPKNELQSEEEYEKAISEMPQLVALKNKNQDDYTKFEAELDRQSREVFKADKYCKPGMPMLVPLTDDVKENAPMSFGRFIGFKIPKDGKPKGIKAVFAVKDSRSSIEVPIISKADVMQSVIDNTYGSFGFGGTNLRDIGGPAYDSTITEEDRRQARDEWWDKMIPKDTNRQIRYMVTGNILQACGSLGKYKGTITTFTRKDPDTGEITVERGMLLAENFDPENFEVRSAVTKDDVWEGYDQIKDNVTNIGVRREGNKMIVTFDRKGREKLSNHPIMKDDGFKALIENGEIDPYSRDQLRAYVLESNVEKVLEYLYKNYSFTKGTLFVMPDSTEKVDKIVYTDKPYKEVIDDFENKYGANEWKIENMIKRAVANYKMDVNNEDLKQKIRELVQLRQAYYRRRYAKDESSRLAWNVIIYDQRIENSKDDKDERDRAFAIREAIKEELAERGVHGNAMHFESGKVPLDTIVKTFNDLNKNKENAELAKRIFALVKKLKLDVIFNEKIHNSVGGQTAGELVEYNWKYMNAEWITDQMKADTILHELVHTVTVYAKRLVDGGYEHLINEDIIDAVQQLDNIYRQIKYNKNFTHQINENGDSYTDYGVSDWFEMMAEAGSNENFRDDLKRTILGVKIMSGMISFTDVTNRTDYTGKTQTAYDAIKERLDVLLDNFSEHGFTEYFRGTMYGERSYSELQRRGRSNENFKNPVERARAITRAVNLAKALGVKFKEDSTISGKGSFNPKTGQILVNIDAHDNTGDLQATILHEAVAHYGLRKLLGKDFAGEIKSLYENASSEIKERIDAIAKENGLSREVATEEYLASLAEDGRFDPNEENFWQRAWYAIQQLLRKLGLRTRLTDADMRALLYASYRNLETRGAVAQANHITIQNALRKAAELSRENANFVDNGTDYDETGASVGDNGGRSEVRGLPGDVAERLSANPDYGSVRVLAEGLASQRREYSLSGTGIDIAESIDRQEEISNYLIDKAKETGQFIPYSEYEKMDGSRLNHTTMESIVYRDAANHRYIKLKNPFVAERHTANNDYDVLYQHVIHNIFFPDTRYDFLGITQTPDGRMRVVLSQDEVLGDKQAQISDILKWAKANGFKFDGQKWLSNGEISFCDFLGENTLHDAVSGEWRFIDPVIRFDEDPRGIIGRHSEITEPIPEEFADGINELPDEVKQQAIDSETGFLYRNARNNATAQTAAQMYGERVRTVGNALYEVAVDEYAPADELNKALENESGIPIKDSERVSDHLREAGGRAMYEIHQYDRKFLQPMWSAVGEFRKKTGVSIDETERYIGLKSGLERNVVLAKRDAKNDYQSEYDAALDEIKAEEKQRKAKLDRDLKSGKISDVTYAGEMAVLQQEVKQKRDDALAVRDAHFADVDSEIDPRYLDYRKNDYSAITAWAETEDVEEAERLASDYVNDMESRAGAETTKELWKRINAATKETLKFQYEHDILSKQQYQDISRMMQYYVPMRGFSDETAEDLFNYYVTAQSNDFQATVLSAKGRHTMYEGPLGNIGAMHSSAVSQGVKNQAKLALLNAVRRRKDNTIATVTRAWFVKNGQKDANGKDVYEVAYPQVPEGATLSQREAIIEQFEKDMAEAKARGDAYNAHREVDLHGGVVAFERESHKSEHIVNVREGGKEYGIIINGNPAAAQAINGVRRSNTTGEKLLGALRGWTRLLSSMFTTFSVPFWVSNFQRDYGQGATNAFIRNDKSYLGRYLANRIKAYKLFPYILNPESFDNAVASGDNVAVLYKQYLENGGPMGQNRIEDNEYFERQMRRYLDNSTKQGVIKGAQSVLDVIGGVGEAIETITRFAVFMTSMESGRALHESISDAKEISTNFARKGSGRSFSKSELDRMVHADGTKLKPVEKGLVNAVSIGVEICRATIPFFNAAIQGLENKVTNYRNNAAKTLIADSVYLMLGLGMKLLLGNAGGDDDKEKYSHTSDYMRRNNILGPVGNGVYAKWALPQEYRVCYAIGDIIGSAIQKERPIDDLGVDLFGAIMQLSPIGVVTDEVVFNPTNKKEAYETLLTNAAPGVLAPVLESIFNMDFKGARIYNEGFNENLRAYPGWKKALPTTGKEYVAAAKFLNELTGGNDVERGWININPAIVEHLVESYFSGPYQIVVRVPEAVTKAVKGEATVRDIPLLNRIILNTNDNQRDALYSNMYYYFKNRNTEAERINTEYKNKPKDGKVSDFFASDDYQYMMVFKKYDKVEKQLRKASKKAAEDGNKDKQKEYDGKLQEIQYKIAQECLDIYFGRNGVK